MKAKTKPGEKVLAPVRPNLGIEAAYRRQLVALIREMASAARRFVSKTYKAHPPQMAQDADPYVPDIVARPVPGTGGKLRWHAYIDGQPLVAKDGHVRSFQSEGAAVRAAKVELDIYLPADEIAAAMEDFAIGWQARFDALGPQMARHFATRVAERSDAALKQALKRAGISVEWQMTPAQLDIVEATVRQNVQLIRSIPQQYLVDVQGAVMRSVQTGRDLEQLTKELTGKYGVAARRAKLIALDQNNKATSALTASRQTEMGIEEAIWQHSHAGREPRPTHLANDGKRYNIKEGWYDPDPKVRRRIWPGELINCRCTSRSIIPGFGAKGY